ncbi:MAG TPA: amidohydrolase [Clostridia bacterium]|nr:amidohydrolase [Clostridia bacterium]
MDWDEVVSYMFEWRKQIHRFPEIGYEEHRTSEFVAALLKTCKCDFVRRVCSTGVVGCLQGAQPGPTVAFRCELDGLAIQEETGLDYASEIAGRMHACAHDGHMAVLLGLCKYLSDRRPNLRGNVAFIFQPAEEMIPKGGARLLISEGVLENPRVDYIIGFHIWPDLNVGTVGVNPGIVMAGGDAFRITFKGRGGHGGAPHTAIDATLIASHSVLALQSIVSREIEPQTPVALSVGMISGGTCPNIVPDSVMLSGTARYLDSELSVVLKEKVGRIAQGVAAVYGGHADVEYSVGYMPTVNSPEVAGIVRECAEEVLGVGSVIWGLSPSMASEDFSAYLEKVPGCYFWVGGRIPDTTQYPLHSPRFAFHDRAMVIALQVCLKLLGHLGCLPV